MRNPFTWLIAFAMLATGHLHAAATDWEPVLAAHCMECHDGDSAKADIDFEAALEQPLGEQIALWEKTVRQLRSRQMPPEGKSRPSDEEYEDLATQMELILDLHMKLKPHPGRTQGLRRMTRYEYGNAVRDLLAVDVDVERLLPADPSSHGFDNITVGDLPPALLDRYISAAEKISRLAIGADGAETDSRTVRIAPDITQEGWVEGLPIGTRGGTVISHRFPRAGKYDVRIHLMRDRDEQVEGLSGLHELQVLLNDAVATTFEVKPPKNRRDHTKVDAHLSARIDVPAGDHQLGVTFVAPAPDLIETNRQPYQSAFNKHRHPRRTPAIYQTSITGPYEPGEPGTTARTATQHLLLSDLEGRDEATATKILQPLLRRAFRGHQDDRDLERALGFFREAATAGFEPGLQAAISSILVSPKLLFRIERDPEGAAPDSVHPISDLDLASRLAFFLWSSIPDDALLDAAEAGQLREPAILAEHTRRMLADPRSRSLVENFAGQWLYLRNLNSIVPDARLYPDFDANLRHAMRRETELLFEAVLREDRSIRNLLHSDHTYLNERLAKHYEIPHVYGERFRKVSLPPESPRGGILRHGSVLTVTSYATRTSPVLRGHWVLKNLLGTPPPPPPPDVPSLEDNRIDASLPIRQRLAAHRENPACAHCHNVMDPIGFAFEHFDAIGQWRDLESGQPVDASGKLAGGAAFDGIAGLELSLLERPQLFARTLTEKLLIYGLGRGVEPEDGAAVRRVVRAAAAEDYRFSAIILGIVASDPFILRRASS